MIATNGISIPNGLLNVTVAGVMRRMMAAAAAVMMMMMIAAGIVIIVMWMMTAGRATNRTVSNVQYMRLSF